MNKYESKALYDRGRGVWNKWAKEILARRDALKKKGNWENEQKIWENAAKVDFIGHKFDKPVNFRSFKFPGTASFIGTSFSGTASFDETTFLDNAWFDEAVFSDNVWFDKATFTSRTSFHLVEFTKFASFETATFTSKNHAANFIAIRSQSQFTLKGAIFSTVPNFEQAHFEEAPSLDKISITLEVPSLFRKKEITTPNEENDVSAHWRHLRRLAQEGHDQEREMDFLAGDIRSRRGVSDYAFGKNMPLFWVGLLFQIFSNFGRSIYRPLFWWIGGILVFAHSYLFAHIIARFGAKTALLDASCFQDYGDPFGAALNLSFARSSVVGTLWARDGVTRAMQCLYNTDNSPFEIGMPIVHLPGWVTAAGYIQSLFSAVMIFLFLLAVRNHFRIR